MTYQSIKGIPRWLKGVMLKHMHQMTTCREFEDFVLSYLDNELTFSQRSVFQLHLRVSRECREYLAAYQRSLEIRRAVFNSPYAPVPDDVPEDLIKAILDERKQ